MTVCRRMDYGLVVTPVVNTYEFKTINNGTTLIVDIHANKYHISLETKDGVQRPDPGLSPPPCRRRRSVSSPEGVGAHICTQRHCDWKVETLSSTYQGQAVKRSNVVDIGLQKQLQVHRKPFDSSAVHLPAEILRREPGWGCGQRACWFEVRTCESGERAHIFLHRPHLRGDGCVKLRRRASVCFFPSVFSRRI